MSAPIKIETLSASEKWKSTSFRWENLYLEWSGLISCSGKFKCSTTQGFCIWTFSGWISEQIEKLTSFQVRVLLWFNTLHKFKRCCFPRSFSLSASVLLISVESDAKSNRALALNLFPFISVTYTGKTCRNGPRRFDLENEFTLPSVGVLFCGGDCFLLSELPFWLSKGSLCRRVWCFCLQPSTRDLNSD